MFDSQAIQETVKDLHTSEMTERAEEEKQEFRPSAQWNHLHSCRDPVVHITLQMLRVLHKWCLGNRTGLESKEVRDTTIHLLQRLLLELGSKIQEESLSDQETKGLQSEVTGSNVQTILEDGKTWASERKLIKDKKHRSKNRCYLSQESAQLNQGDPFKTWDHPFMPLSFPDLDFDQMTMERSHTAPERTSLCIYYSPPSARRVHLAQLKKTPFIFKNTPTPVSLCRKLSSPASPICFRFSANLSDDMKELTASLRQADRSSSSLEGRKGRLSEGWMVEVASAGTQTQIPQPQMVNVGLQTDGPQGSGSVRVSPPRVLSSPLVSSKSHHMSSSLERMPGRTDRPKSGSTSPKFYSASSLSSPSSLFSTKNSSSNSSSSSISTPSRERGLISSPQRGSVRSTWAPPTNSKSGQGLKNITLSSDVSNAGHHTKSHAKPAGSNRYGLVSEFLRRVSGRADSPASGMGQKGKSNLKNLERLPSTRPPAGLLHRNDSITRIVNQRFMKQREEAGRLQKEEKEQTPNQAVKGLIQRDQSLSTITPDDGNYECSSNTLTFCFARPSRTTRHASNQVRLPRHGYAPEVSGSGDTICE